MAAVPPTRCIHYALWWESCVLCVVGLKGCLLFFFGVGWLFLRFFNSSLAKFSVECRERMACENWEKRAKAVLNFRWIYMEYFVWVAIYLKVNRKTDQINCEILMIYKYCKSCLLYLDENNWGRWSYSTDLLSKNLSELINDTYFRVCDGAREEIKSSRFVAKVA